MSTPQADYGSLAPLVKAAGWLIASSVAIGASWKRRANFEPSEQDIGKAAQRVGGLIAAVLIALLWSQYAVVAQLPFIVKWLIISSCVTVASLLIYGVLVGSLTFTKRLPNAPNAPVERKIIGGFWKTAHARKVMKQRNLTPQAYYEGCRYDEDKVWPKFARSLSKQTFVLAYLGLTIAGTIALSLAAILLLLRNS